MPTTPNRLANRRADVRRVAAASMTAVVVAAGLVAGASRSDRAPVPASPRHGPAVVGLLGGPLSLAAEPDDANRAVDRVLASAGRSIDLALYELDDRAREEELIAAHRRGAAVRVLLDRAGAGAAVNADAVRRLSAAGVDVRWAPAGVILHEKALGVDGRRAAMMTGNLVTRDEAASRDLVITLGDPTAVAAIESTFDADWSASGPSAPRRGRLPAPKGATGLLWSPGAEPALVALVGSARRRVSMEAEELGSAPVADALEQAVRRGVRVTLTMSASSRWAGELNRLSAAGVTVWVVPDSRGTRFIHAKDLVVDDERAFVGSQNLSTAGLWVNRELGIVTAEPAVVAGVRRVIEADRSLGARLRAAGSRRSVLGPVAPAQSTSRIASAELTVRPGPGSTSRVVTTPSSMTIAYRCERVPSPKPLPSISRPTALVNSPLPSASMHTVSPTCCASAHAPITNGSLTDRQATVSTPFSFSWSWRTTKLGRWKSEQVGVKAPGTAKSTTFPEPSTSAVCTWVGPSGPNVITRTSGILSPTAMVTWLSFARTPDVRRARHRAPPSAAYGDRSHSRHRARPGGWYLEPGPGAGAQEPTAVSTDRPKASMAASCSSRVSPGSATLTQLTPTASSERIDAATAVWSISRVRPITSPSGT